MNGARPPAHVRSTPRSPRAGFGTDPLGGPRQLVSGARGQLDRDRRDRCAAEEGTSLRSMRGRSALGTPPSSSSESTSATSRTPIGARRYHGASSEVGASSDSATRAARDHGLGRAAIEAVVALRVPTGRERVRGIRPVLLISTRVPGSRGLSDAAAASRTRERAPTTRGGLGVSGDRGDRSRARRSSRGLPRASWRSRSRRSAPTGSRRAHRRAARAGLW